MTGRHTEGWLGTVAGIVGVAAIAATLGCARTGDGEPARWPSRPITLLVAFGAGGGTDANARIVAGLLETELGQPVTVVNRTGGGGVVGHAAVADAVPDGYTLGYVTIEVAMMHWAGLTDLTHEDFTPLAMISGTPGSLLVRADGPHASASDLLETIRAGGAGLKASGSGLGGVWHVTLGGVLDSVGIEPDAVTWVPHQGAAPALVDLAAGGVDFVVSALPEARALLDAGRVRALAVIDEQPSAVRPDVPTLESETGSDWSVLAWGGVAGPRGLPDEVVERLSGALRAVAQSPELRQMFERRGTGLAYRDAAAFGRYMAESDARFGEVMSAIGLRR